MKELFYDPQASTIKKVGQTANSVVVYTTTIFAVVALFKLTAELTTETSRMIRTRRAKFK